MIAPRVDESRAYGRRSIRPGVMILRDRQDERAVLDGVLKRARAGRGGVLVVRGEAGIGKTALLDYAIESASDLKIAARGRGRVRGGACVRGSASVVRAAARSA